MERFCEGGVVSGRLFAVGDEFAAGDDRRVVATITFVVYERVSAPSVREVELESYPALRESGRTTWEALNRLVGGHRALLERRWWGS